MMLDGELLQCYAKHHDQAAFAELVRRHLDGVFSAALRRVGGDRHLAEDVAQQVFVQLARQAARVAHHPVLTGWLYITTRNQAVMAVRAEQRRKVREAEAHLMNERVSESSSELDWSRVAPVLDWAIEQLPEADRTAVLLRFIARKPFEEVGAILKVSGDAARMRVDRALEKLRIILARRGIRSTAVLLGAELARQAVVAAPVALSASVTAAALASAPATLGAVATALQFMTTSKFISGAAAGLLLFAAGGSTVSYQLRARRAAEEALTAANDQRAVGLGHLEEARRRLQTATTALEAEEQKLAAEKAALVTVEAERKAEAAARDPKALGKAFLERHPEVRQAFIEWSNRKVNSRWGNLFKALHFTPAQIEEFQALMLAQTSQARPADQEGKTYMVLSIESEMPRAESERRLRALLGEEGQKLRQEISRQAPAKEMATIAAGVLAFSDAPLTSDQAGNLLQLFAEHRLKAGSTQARSFDWDTVMAKSTDILSPSQLKVVDGLRAQDEYQQALSHPSIPVAAQSESGGKSS